MEDENIEIDIIEPKNVILKWESESQSLLIFSVRPIPSEMMKTMCFIRKTRSNQRNQVFSA